MDVNVTTFEIETKTRHGDMVRAAVTFGAIVRGPFLVLLGCLALSLCRVRCEKGGIKPKPGMVRARSSKY
jgi:hypothetical protein